MALSPGSVEAGSRSLWGIQLPRIALLDLQHCQRAVQEIGIPINQGVLTIDAFRGMNGRRQERFLLFLLKTGNLDMVAKLRPDFQVDYPVSWDEKAESFLVGELVRRKTPIIPSSDIAPNSMFAQIYALSYPIGEHELVDKLEREKQRAQEEFPDAFFAPAENLGLFCAARRYYASLVMALDKDVRYSRDFFRPVMPVLKEEKFPTERERRAILAHGAYDQEEALPGTWA